LNIILAGNRQPFCGIQPEFPFLKQRLRELVGAEGLQVVRLSREVAVDFLAIKAANKRHAPLLENKAEPVIAHADAIVFATGFQSFEIGNLLERPGGFHLLDDLLDPAQQRGIPDG
jgi:hypothetical protein